MKSYACSCCREGTKRRERPSNANEKQQNQEPMTKSLQASNKIQGVKDDLENSKSETFVSPRKEVRNLFEIGVETEITKLKRRGKFDRTRTKLRTMQVTLSTVHDARVSLTEEVGKHKELDARSLLILREVSKEDTNRENFCLTKLKISCIRGS